MPTGEQAIYLDRLFGACRFVYNLALETKIRAWEAKISISAYDLMKQLVELKHTECQWLKDFPSQVLEYEMSHLDSAYKQLFQGGGFPRFKRRGSKNSASFRQGTRIVGNKAYLSKIGAVEFIKHRELPQGEIRTTTVSKKPTGKYFVSILIKNADRIPDKAPIIPETSIGVDVGLKTFATISDGSKVDNPKYLDEQLKRLRIEQRKLSRRFKKGVKEQSKNYHKQKLLVAKLHEKISNKRTDFLQKLTFDLIRANDTICVETLNIKGMVKNPKLSKAISDVGWHEFVRMLKYKGEWYGKNIIEIGMFEPSSKTCSNCGFHHKELALSDRTWDCDNCGVTHDRDINAAINIKNFGLEAKPTTAKTSHKAVSIGCEQYAAK